ncbi:MAG TPA: hypothetical protein VEK33_03935 [Terriglobales bacterium]|nr:hypothetical protein [Terriglobales bacterium]
MLHKNPQQSIRHISDEELVRSADGELSLPRAAEVEAHLGACWDCRARMEEIQSTMTAFVRAHHAEFDRQIPPAVGPRALLRARLAELGSESRTEWWKRIFQFGFNLPRAAIVCLTLIAMTFGILWFRHALPRKLRSASVLLDAGIAPNRSLTPGATRQVTLSEVCSVPQEEVVRDVSVSLKGRVFQEYGIVNARPEDYEIDFLIAPGLGGIEDIRNLWPEPYRARVWNAHVKDALEERLHEMVCSGQLDLSTAQREIATDWIAAYQKYFHTDRPSPSIRALAQ